MKTNFLNYPLLILLLSILYAPQQLKAQCPPADNEGNLEFYSQEEVDDFIANYPNCTELQANLILRSDDITDLSPFSNLQSIAGDFESYSSDGIQNLDALSNLQHLGGNLYLSFNTNLENIDGLSGLKTIDGSIIIISNSPLKNINGLSNVEEVGGDVELGGIELENIDGLSSLRSIGSDLSIDRLRGVQSINGFASLETIGGNVWLAYNDNLQYLGGFQNLQSVGEDLDFVAVGSLSSIDGFRNLSSVGGDFSVRIHDNLTNLDNFSNLINVGGEIEITNNSQLTNFNGICPVLTGGFDENNFIQENNAAVFDPANCISCEILSIDAVARACEDGSTTYSQEITVAFENGAGDLQIDANGQQYSFSLSTNPQTVTLTGLPLDGNPVDITASFSEDAGCTLTEEALFTAPSALSIGEIADEDLCLGQSTTLTASPSGGVVPYAYLWSSGGETTSDITVSPTASTTYSVSVTDAIGCQISEDAVIDVIGISSVVASSQSACDPWTNTYTQSLEIAHIGAPSTGQLSVNGQLFPIKTSPQTVVLTGLISDGSAVNINAFFTDKAACTFEENTLFTAPTDCSVPCEIISITAGDDMNCDPNTDTYDRDLTIAYQGTNLTGSFMVSINGGSPISYPLTSQSPQTISLIGLPSNGQEVDIEVSISEATDCRLTVLNLFQNPLNCGQNPTGDCDIADLIVGDQSCNYANSTYSQELGGNRLYAALIA